VECAGADRDGGPGCRAAAVGADREADQCRIPDLSFDSASQHHDARAAGEAVATGHSCTGIGSRAATGRGAAAGTISVTLTSASRRQEAATAAETAVHCGTGPARAVGFRGCRQRAVISTTSDLFKVRLGRYIGGIMPLHLIKLAVGCESVKELKGWVAERMATAKKKGLPLRHVHVTRMTPKRDGEILAGGSLYWVIKGEIAAREKIIAIEPFRDKDGIGRCRLVMQPRVFAVSPRPMRPFQGWRYLTEDAAPPDLTKSSAASVAAMPEPMRRELRDLGLL
jgi:hypothetical protein